VQPSASWGVLPDVMPYVAEASTQIAYVVAVADRTGADLEVVLGPRSVRGTVEGDQTHPLHKTRRNQWNERQFQNRVENAWEKNEREVADAVVRHVQEVGAQLVVISGEQRACALLKRDLEELLPPGVALAEVGAGGRAPGASPEALHEAVHDAVLKLVWRRRRELIERLQQDLGRHAFALTGAAEVIDALRKAQADTVVLTNDPSSTLRAWVGPEPLQVGTSEQELHDMGVDEPHEVRFDAALTRAAVGSGADIEVTPSGHNFLKDGIAALLRYDDAATPS
jgi:phosphoglycolate phosphatase-like HAD superfamily hydrolase